MQDPADSPVTPDLSKIENTEEQLSPDSKVDGVQNIEEPVSTLGEAEEKLPKEESRARRGFRKFIRWSAGLLIFFGMGFLTAVYTLYNPVVDELDQLQTNFNNAETSILELETQINDQQVEIRKLTEQIDSITLEIEALENEKQSLSEDQDRFNLHIALLQARADVVSGQVKLYETNPTQGRVLLQSASQNLTNVKSLLPDDLKDVITPLQTRLELAIGGINSDLETAITDLSKIAGDLREIENAKVWE